MFGIASLNLYLPKCLGGWKLGLRNLAAQEKRRKPKGSRKGKGWEQARTEARHAVAAMPAGKDIVLSCPGGMGQASALSPWCEPFCMEGAWEAVFCWRQLDHSTTGGNPVGQKIQAWFLRSDFYVDISSPVCCLNACLGSPSPFLNWIRQHLEAFQVEITQCSGNFGPNRKTWTWRYSASSFLSLKGLVKWRQP